MEKELCYVRRKWKMKKVEKSENNKSDYVQWSEWRRKSWKRWWYILQKWEKEKKRKEYLSSLIDDLPGNLLQVLPFCFGGVQRIDHKLELSPHAHYIVKHIKNEVMQSLEEENVFMNYRWLSRSLVILALEFTCKLNKNKQGKVEEEDENKRKWK